MGRTGVEGAAAGGSGIRRLMHDYKQLSKLKLSSLVVLTASAGFAAASGESIDYAKLAWTCLGTLGAAACANTLNQVYEVANDRLMTRTRNRPLPAGRMGRLHALAFAAVCGTAGLWILNEKANTLTAVLGASNILLYAAIYTPLKQVTVANTWVGAVVGAIPPLMGWASAAGDLDAGSAVLAAALFFWQMPHFLALAWLCKADYAAGGFRMLSMVDPTGRRTALAALRHSLYIAPVGLLAVLAGFATEPFAWEAAALAAYLLRAACGVVEGAAVQLGEALVVDRMKCPSKAYGDSEELHGPGEQQGQAGAPQQQQREQAQAQEEPQR
ncbi:hypothetical protein GPECTOR_325g41 [Gonium pectorale]|uniref:Heme O synthase n=1 Tax=Gonium pectorale TaxID=33097 RepID=A0A150FVN3_GONPE|nr:hypothetical protein GPECTOR_325g41 [Gonium pectorale]|eukprot:KXZ41674.1 hypothetical protein GPECTOR_325g41 [Gonium pectorale]